MYTRISIGLPTTAGYNPKQQPEHGLAIGIQCCNPSCFVIYCAGGPTQARSGPVWAIGRELRRGSQPNWNRRKAAHLYMIEVINYPIYPTQRRLASSSTWRWVLTVGECVCDCSYIQVSPYLLSISTPFYLLHLPLLAHIYKFTD